MRGRGALERVWVWIGLIMMVIVYRYERGSDLEVCLRQVRSLNGQLDGLL